MSKQPQDGYNVQQTELANVSAVNPHIRASRMESDEKSVEKSGSTQNNGIHVNMYSSVDTQSSSHSKVVIVLFLVTM